MGTLAFKQIQVETLPDGVALPLRWITVKQAVQFYPFGRAKLYELMNAGAIKSFAYKEPGKRSRKRLIDKDSIDAYLERSERTLLASEQTEVIENEMAANSRQRLGPLLEIPAKDVSSFLCKSCPQGSKKRCRQGSDRS